MTENVAQNESFVLSKVTPASKVPPFHGTNAFDHVVPYVWENVIEKYQAIKLSHLQLTCVKNTWQHLILQPRLRDKQAADETTDTFSVRITLVTLEPEEITFYLNYSRNLPTSTAVKAAYKMAMNDNIKKTALRLRRIVLTVFNEMTEQPFPPDLEKKIIDETTIPSPLFWILSLIIETGHHQSERCCRQELSLWQNLCRAITNGEWKLPQHILLCLMLQHLYSSKGPLTILNRLSHSENDTFAIEKEARPYK